MDETANVASREQLNLTIRYINNDYIISEDSIGLFSLPDTTAKILHAVVKYLLLRWLIKHWWSGPAGEYCSS